MDEDQPKKKITINNFFEQIVEIDKVAQTALTNSNNLELQFKSIQLDLTRLVQTLSAFDPIQTQLSQVTNIIVQNQIDRGLALDQREKEVFAAEDKKQKTIESKKEDKKGIDELKEESLSDQIKNRLKESVKDIREEISKSGALGLGLASLGSYSLGSVMGDKNTGGSVMGDKNTGSSFDFDNSEQSGRYTGGGGRNNPDKKYNKSEVSVERNDIDSGRYTGGGGRNNPDKKYNGGEVFGERNDIDTVPALLTKGETVASKSETKRMKQSGFTSISGLLSFLENMRKKMFNNFGGKDGEEYKDGGEVKKTGLSKVHQGEFVSTEKTVEMFGSDFLSRLNQIADMNSYSLTGDAAELIGNDQEFLSEVNTVSAKHGINPAHLLGLIASESGFNPKAQNPDTNAAGLLQFKPEVAERYGTTVDKILKMSRVEQMRYVDMYLKDTLPKNPSLGQLYTSTLMPSYASESPDFELMAKDARYGSGNAQMYSRNEGLDTNEDGVITIKELGPRITGKMKEFGIIEKPIENNVSNNIVLPPQIVQGTNQTINDGGSRGDVRISSDSVESTKSPIQSISIAEFNSIENLNILVS